MKKRCYYQILEVEKKATISDIKQNYRKLALKYHPDKNDSDQAKQMFIEVQEAYQVLSDPNERTWYDNNREKILFDKDSMSKEDLEMHTFGFNIWTYFSPSCYKGYEQQDEKNFYKIYRQVFERIKESQKQAYQYENELEEQFRRFEGFGDSKTSLDKVLRFYDDWDNMTTYKSFVWKEQWDTKQAPNRWVRREMQKQNKKQRQKQRKFYIKTVKDLISYLKKRDPRYQNHLMQLNEKEKKRQQQKKLKLQQQKKFKQQQKQIKKQLQEQRLRQIEEYYQQQGQNNSDEDNNKKLDRSHEQQFYCEICDKGFKSQNQLNNHQKSKIHKQNLKLLMSQVVIDADKKDLQKQIIKAFEPPVKQKPQFKQQKDKIIEQQIQTNEEDKSNQKKKKKNKKRKQYQLSSQEQKEQIIPPPKVAIPKKQQRQQKQEQSSDDDGFMNAMLKNRGKNQNNKPISTKTVQFSDEQTNGKKKKKQSKKIVKKQQESQQQEQEEAPEKTLGKAKQKRLKKLQKLQQQKDKFKCIGCKQLFTSKTKLFTHINQTGHAALKK